MYIQETTSWKHKAEQRVQRKKQTKREKKKKKKKTRKQTENNKELITKKRTKEHMDRITRGESPSPRPIKKRTTKTSEQLVMGFALSSKVHQFRSLQIHLIGFVYEVCFSVTMNIMSPGFVLLVYLLGHDWIIEALFGCSYWNYKQSVFQNSNFTCNFHALFLLLCP